MKTKAEEKREKQTFELIWVRMSKLLKSFENKYMKAYTDWNMSIIKSKAEKFPELETFEDFKNMFLGKTYAEAKLCNPGNSYWASKIVSSNKCWETFEEKNEAVNQLKNDYLTKFKFMSEAAKGYETKLTTLVNKMVSFGFNVYHLNLEYVCSKAGEISILVKNDERTVHARVIWAEGEVNAPHYRFITTERKN